VLKATWCYISRTALFMGHKGVFSVNLYNLLVKELICAGTYQFSLCSTLWIWFSVLLD
jgi:hypothetical protein